MKKLFPISVLLLIVLRTSFCASKEDTGKDQEDVSRAKQEQREKDHDRTVAEYCKKNFPDQIKQCIDSYEKGYRGLVICNKRQHLLSFCWL